MYIYYFICIERTPPEWKADIFEVNYNLSFFKFVRVTFFLLRLVFSPLLGRLITIRGEPVSWNTISIPSPRSTTLVFTIVQQGQGQLCMRNGGTTIM